MARSNPLKSLGVQAETPPKVPAISNSKAVVYKPNGSKHTVGDYTSDGVEDNDVFLLPVSDYHVMLAITVLAAAVRLFRIYQPSSVVFDEVHFGGFASKYVQGRFFIDVHPPLAKLLITLFGWLAGFDGDFDFKDIGKDYIEPGVPYVAMRMFPAICGTLLAPTMFLTLKASGCQTATATMGAGLIIFENGLLTQARLILLDSPLMIGTAFTALAFTCFSNQQELGPSRAFSHSWWFWLVMTGFGLGITFSIKWVGLFTIAWVGSLTLVQLWVMLGDYHHVTLRIWSKHFIARAFSLIIIPATLYMTMFAIHFICLANPGEGDGFMSSEFQATLNSKSMQDTPVDVLLGSRLVIRHWNTQGGYLHSHPLMYPTGSKQQQITLYPHKDENNIWLLENQTQPLDSTGEPVKGTHAWDNLHQFVEDGNVIRLYHSPTHRRLHSHDVRPPITEADWQNEVSAYGYDGFDGDANDFFRVEIVKRKSKAGAAQKRLRTIETKFRLIHIMTGCALFSHKVKLPEWASEQQEVTCAKQGSLPNSIWYVESNEHPMLDATAERVNYDKPGFLGKFIEVQKVMWRTNAGLIESHAWDSRPPSWPILRRGINFWGKDHRQIYLIGNPLIWWSATAAVVVYAIFKGVAILRWQRRYSDYSHVTFKRFDYEIGTSVLGWALHYFPFFLMQRQLFLHHYFPALYFSIMAFCQVVDFVTARVFVVGQTPLINKVATLGFLACSAIIFGLLSPLAYGNVWTKAQCNSVKLFSTWDFDCNTFLTSYDDYKTETPSIVAVQTPQKMKNPPPPDLPPAAPQDEAQKPLGGGSKEAPQRDVSGAPPALGRILSREERVEYRDEDGNILDDKQVRALEGKVEFKTRYETRTRLVDADGMEMLEAEDDQKVGVAPPHPDVQGVDQSTKNSEVKVPAAGEEAFRVAEESIEGEKEQKGRVAKPASEGTEATKKEL